MRKVFKRVIVILAIAFVSAQFVRPARTNPSFASTQTIENVVNVPPDIHATLMRACGDCHSDQTEWPWYSHVAPTSWFVINHVNSGRKHINFSTWMRPGKEPQDSIDRLKAICREVQEGAMPLTSYTLIHWSAKLSADDVKGICKWSELEQQRLGGVTPGK
ncbi:MAG: heme-binding domain-containing protein [Candidatus Acidiferrales bacterium]